MISVNEATALINSFKLKPSHEVVNLDQAVGRFLAEDLYADLNQPPFNRVAMDGFAFRFADLLKCDALKISGVVPAGDTVSVLGEGSCLEIMTGAALPENADFIVRYEDCTVKDGKVFFQDKNKLKNNIHIEGSDYKKGTKLISKNTKILSPHIALLASAGKSLVPVFKQPKVLIISTGSELVNIDECPKAGQIRWSNGVTLKTELMAFGIKTVEMLKLKDDQAIIFDTVKELLPHYDILLFTGGVSAGKFDFIPNMLTDLGVTKVFHKVSQRPGKPLWFGHLNGDKIFFGLPGNPVSSLVNLRRYVIPFITNSRAPRYVQLDADYSKEIKLSAFLPVNLEGALVRMIEGNGSGDFYHLKDSTGFIELNTEDAPFNKGKFVPYYGWGLNDQ